MGYTGTPPEERLSAKNLQLPARRGHAEKQERNPLVEEVRKETAEAIHSITEQPHYGRMLVSNKTGHLLEFNIANDPATGKSTLTATLRYNSNDSNPSQAMYKPEDAVVTRWAVGPKDADMIEQLRQHIKNEELGIDGVAYEVFGSIRGQTDAQTLSGYLSKALRDRLHAMAKKR